VRAAVPLAASPATVIRTTSAELEIRMPKPGSVIVRVAYSPWLHADGACLRQQGEFTRLTVSTPGVYRIGSEYFSADTSTC
jgi:hypothetical protein